MSYFAALRLIFLVVAVVSVGVIKLFGPLVLSRRSTWILGILWVVAVTAEFWILGPYSFVGTPSELEYSIPVSWYEFLYHDGGQIDLSRAGGVDHAANFVHLGQLVSLQGLMIRVLPPWGVSMVHNLLLSGLGFAGMYLVARRMASAPREIAFCVAALVTLAHDYVTVASWHHGFGYGLIPLAIYLCVGRIGRRWYWPGVVALSVVHAASCSVPHSVIALLPGIGLVGIWMKPRRWLIWGGALLVLTAALLVVWGEPIYAKMQFTPFSYRATVSLASPTLQSLVDQYLLTPFMPLGLAAVVITFRRDRRESGIMAMVLLTAMIGGALLQEIPWERFHAAALRGMSFANISLVHQPLTLLALAWAVGRHAREPAQRWIGIGLMGIVAGSFAWHKVNNVSNYLAYGGLAGVDRIPNLAEPRWRDAEPKRVLTVPYRLPNQLTAAYGLDSVDGNFNLGTRHYTQFWRYGVMRRPNNLVTGFLTIENDWFDFKCCGVYDLDEYVDTGMLRVLNVGYVLSYLPLRGADLQWVDGPLDPAAAPPRRGDPLLMRMRGYFDWNIHPRPVHVYRVSDPLARVYAARGMVVVADEAEDAEVVASVRNHGLQRVVTLRTGDGVAPSQVSDRLEVGAFGQDRDHIWADVTAAGDGLVVFNMNYLPFWSAEVDGEPARIVPVNLSQLAVLVPKGGKRVDIRYRRPTLASRLFGHD